MLDKTNKVRGYFKYTLRDAKTREIIDSYEEENQIMSQVPKMYFELVSGLQTPTKDATGATIPAVDTISTLKAEDFRLCAVVLGDQGFDSKNGVAKTINPDDYVINAMKKVNGKFAGNAYQATWEKLTEHESMKPTGVTGQPYPGCKILTEGSLNPNGYLSPSFKDPGMNNISSKHTETGLDVVSDVRNGVITFNFTLLEKSGNGIDFSEAALFVHHNQDEAFTNGSAGSKAIDTSKYPGDPRDSSTPGFAGSGIPSLGTIFSMKTFKPVNKTNACVLEMEWKLDFNL